jgi:hypothetical protein
MCYPGEEMVVFAGMETGQFTRQGLTLPLTIRTSRIFYFSRELGCWYQLHHHGSIDNPKQLDAYQKAIAQ